MRCNDCGMRFTEPDRVRERQGEYFGASAYEDYDVCPYCQSTDIEETVACRMCGEESEHEICSDCVEKLSTDETVLRYSSDEPEEIELGSLFLYHFSKSEIEEILMREMSNSGKWQELKKDYIMSDYEDYIDWMEEHIDEL